MFELPMLSYLSNPTIQDLLDPSLPSVSKDSFCPPTLLLHFQQVYRLRSHLPPYFYKL